ncbi:MAG: urea carboxylase-associated family protein [SAR202 cluster bacterium]|nr:urea carboxylase-associated family protein [SAR202 cluster bacterium]
MALRVQEGVVIPARHGRAVLVRKGQVLRIHQTEQQQVGDRVFLNAANPREHFHVGQTWAINVFLGTGNARAFQHFYSNPPHENVLLTVVDDTVRRHFGNMGGRCTPRLLELRDGGAKRRTCQENLVEALAPFHVPADGLGDCFNVFMNVDMDADGNFKVLPSTAKHGDRSPVNNFGARSLGLQVLG